MKLLLLADPGSIHTIRWAQALSGKGISVYIFGLSSYDNRAYEGFGITICSQNISPFGLFNKLSYLTAIWKLKKWIRDIKPDVMHAHYASSYGLLGNLSGFKPFIISVWGTDVYDFPKKSPLHRALLEYNLRGADIILSTSRVMAEETRKYASRKDIEITPFGVDLDRFRPFKVKSPSPEIVIGTVKSLFPVYGIDILIRSFALLKIRNPAWAVKLVIAGEGHEKKRLITLTRSLKVAKDVVFLGKVAHAEIPQILNNFDIYAAFSYEESFGVAVIEASACNLPVVVSDAPGLREVVVNNKTGIIVPRGNPELGALALDRLIKHPDLRQKMGNEGRRHVTQLYDWNSNIRQMVEIYHKILTSCNKNKN